MRALQYVRRAAVKIFATTELMTEEDSIQDTVMPATTMTQMAVFPTTAYQSNFLAQFEAEHPGLFNK